MRAGLHVGQTAELTTRVGPEHVIHLAGDGAAGGATVFSTPAMINLMEHAAREVLRPYLEPGEESVGVEVHVEHLAATPIGAPVRAIAKVTGIDGRTVDFQVEAYDEAGLIGRAAHRRAAISTERFAERLIQRASQLPGSFSSTMRIHPISGELPRFETLSVNRDGGIATVTLNRPGQRNAVNRAMTGEWEQLIAWLAGHEDVRAVVVTGAGSAFCAGDDVKEVGTLPLEEARELSLRQARIYLAFEQLPQVIIAAVNGPALGAGCVCAYSCDFRIASHAARFGMPEILLGWPPGYGIAQLTALVGKARALELCLTGKPISTGKAFAFGLVHEVVAQNRLLDSARSLAQRLLALPPRALIATKRLVHTDEGQHIKLAHLTDTSAYIECLATADAREGIAAFMEKRPPRFTGK